MKIKTVFSTDQVRVVPEVMHVIYNENDKVF